MEKTMWNLEKLLFGRLTVPLLIAMSLLGCSTMDRNTPDAAAVQNAAAATALVNKTGWQLKKLADDDGQLHPPLAKTVITLYFEGDRMRGSSGCNSYFGTYRVSVKDNTLAIGDTGFTMMACEDAIMQQERRYLYLLQQTASFRRTGEQLQLLDQTGDVLLVFAIPDVMPLKETQWQLLSFNSGNGMLSNLYTGDITAVFDNQGRLSGFSGCNRYYSSYTLKGGKLQLSPIITTRKHCLPEELMNTEAGYLAALGKVESYQIRERQLTLYGAGDLRLAVFNVAE